MLDTKTKKGFMIDADLQTCIDNSCLFLWMTGARKSELLQESQRILSKDEATRQFLTTCPAREACKVVNGVALHRLRV